MNRNNLVYIIIWIFALLKSWTLSPVLSLIIFLLGIYKIYEVFIKEQNIDLRRIKIDRIIKILKTIKGVIIKWIPAAMVIVLVAVVAPHWGSEKPWYDSSRISISITGGDDTDIDSQSLIFQGDTEEWDMLSEVEKQKYLVFVDTKNEKIKVFSRGDDRMTQAKITLPRENVGFTLKYEIDGSGGILFEASDISDSNAYPNLERSTSNSGISYYEYHISDTRWKVIGGNDYFEESYASTCDREGRSMIPSITLSPSYSQEMTIEKRSFFS